MSLDLTDIYEDDLRMEIARRYEARRTGVCDYCGREPNTPVCRFPGRHRRGTRIDVDRASLALPDPLSRLCLWLVEHPVELADVAARIHLPLPSCEGYSGPCGHSVLWVTHAMTAYEWDGTGVNPNRPLLLCPECSAGYVDYWKEMWRDYYASVL